MAKTKIFCLWLDQETYNRLRQMARQRDVSIAYLVRSAIREYLREREQRGSWLFGPPRK